MSAGGQANKGVEEDPKPSRAAIFFSGLVFPGVGQAMQKRWVAGVFYALGFVAAFAYAFVSAAGILFSYYSFLQWDTEVQWDQARFKAHLVRMFLSFLIVLAVYFSNLRLQNERRCGHATPQFVAHGVCLPSTPY